MYSMSERLHKHENFPWYDYYFLPLDGVATLLIAYDQGEGNNCINFNILEIAIVFLVVSFSLL